MQCDRTDDVCESDEIAKPTSAINPETMNAPSPQYASSACIRREIPHAIASRSMGYERVHDLSSRVRVRVQLAPSVRVGAGERLDRSGSGLETWAT